MGNLAKVSETLLMSVQEDSEIRRLRDVLQESRFEYGNASYKTVAARNTLAKALRNAGNFNEAIDLYQGTLELHLARLGPIHPQTLRSRSRLANTYYAAGQYGKAAGQFKDILNQRALVLGQQHPDTLRSRGSLANTYACLGLHTEAAALHLQTLQEREEVLGQDHPRTRLSRRRLESALKAAESLGTQVNEDRTK